MVGRQQRSQPAKDSPTFWHRRRLTRSRATPAGPTKPIPTRRERQQRLAPGFATFASRSLEASARLEQRAPHQKTRRETTRRDTTTPPTPRAGSDSTHGSASELAGTHVGIDVGISRAIVTGDEHADLAV